MLTICIPNSNRYKFKTIIGGIFSLLMFLGLIPLTFFSRRNFFEKLNPLICRNSEDYTKVTINSSFKLKSIIEVSSSILSATNVKMTNYSVKQAR